MLRRFLCFTCVLFGGFFASSCVETVPWADPVQCEEAGCTAANRECTALNRFEVDCGKCLDGFELRGGECLPIGMLQSCEDLDCGEQHRSCDAQANADAQCGACVDGYVEETGTCRPRTPCEQNADICGEGDCIDAGDDYNCECFAGFDFDGTECVDVDECEADSEVCGDNATCSNTIGSYECACIDGFEFDDSATCVDIDECEANADACGPNEACTNTSGSYECACIDGFEFDGTACVDIDECEADPEVCGDNATCSNTIGSYECACIEGFEFDDSDTCVGVDECALLDDVCEDREVCTSTFGSYECVCMEGFLPTEIGCQPRVLDIAAGYETSCAVVEGGDLYCWGSATGGELGIGEQTSTNAPPTLVEGNHRWRSVELSLNQTCGITLENDLYCWGNPYYGRLGIGPSPPSNYITTPYLVAGDHKWLEAHPNAYHGCGLTQDFELYCWGWNRYGQVGVVPTPGENIWTPVAIRPDLMFTELMAGWSHAFARTHTGNLYIWGYNGDNRLGLAPPSTDIIAPPALIDEDYPWSVIEPIAASTCGISEGALYCWGKSVHGGELGLGSPTVAVVPTRVGNETGWTQISVTYATVCALRDGDAYCWGRIRTGASTHQTFTTPTLVHHDRKWSHIDIGDGYGCGISEGLAYCWGWNGKGQTGHDEPHDVLTAAPVQFFP